jgi:hypothetical protein
VAGACSCHATRPRWRPLLPPTPCERLRSATCNGGRASPPRGPPPPAINTSPRCAPRNSLPTASTRGVELPARPPAVNTSPRCAPRSSPPSASTRGLELRRPPPPAAWSSPRGRPGERRHPGLRPPSRGPHRGHAWESAGRSGGKLPFCSFAPAKPFYRAGIMGGRESIRLRSCFWCPFGTAAWETATEAARAAVPKAPLLFDKSVSQASWQEATNWQVGFLEPLPIGKSVLE